MKNMKLEHFKRFLGFIPFAMLSLVAVMFLWFKYIINFIRFGGEAIAYTDKHQRKTIKDIYNILEPMMKSEIEVKENKDNF